MTLGAPKSGTIDRRGERGRGARCKAMRSSVDCKIKNLVAMAFRLAGSGMTTCAAHRMAGRHLPLVLDLEFLREML
jgi:hypothetical protein